jgi:hypothetical protein
MPENDEHGRVILHLSTPEYEAMMCAMEAVATKQLPPEDMIKAIRSVWLRRCYEGGHITFAEMQKIRKELKVAGP